MVINHVLTGMILQVGGGEIGWPAIFFASQVTGVVAQATASHTKFTHLKGGLVKNPMAGDPWGGHKGMKATRIHEM